VNIERRDAQAPHADWTDAQQQFQGLLLRALSGFAKNGLAVPPDDGWDLISDFFCTEWTKIHRSYDSSRGSLNGYVYRAFVYYARPRIRKLKQWRNTLVDTQQLGRLIADDDREPSESAAERETIQERLRELPGFQRQVLLQFLEQGETERELADRFATTRYQIRETLCDAFGTILAAVAKHQQFSRNEWSVIQLLWSEGRSPRETARQLGITTSDVQAIRSRVRKIIAREALSLRHTTN
jgi:RNA polymerase sigma factor (sigma-70 family)